MTKDYMELQAKYIEGSMCEEEIRAFLALLKSDIDAPFRNDRISKLERRLAEIAREKNSCNEYEHEWVESANEYKGLTEKWLELGARWCCIGNLTRWHYNGEEFYRWWSRSLITDNIVNAREADKRLAKLVAKEATE